MQEKWSDEELRDAVRAYIDMLNKYNNGISFTKNHYYEELAKKYNRTENSFRLRMYNISYVFYLLGRSYLPGFKPLQNVGQKNIQKIEQFINEIENRQFSPVAAFESSVIELLTKNENIIKPVGIRNPTHQTTQVSIFNRDVNVKAWILKNSHGICEVCKKNAPFQSFDGLPFLEVHHVKRLADGGTDTITNAVAICPNCHREIHYGENRDSLIDKIYKTVKRIKSE